jgi:hypothetical protein
VNTIAFPAVAVLALTTAVFVVNGSDQFGDTSVTGIPVPETEAVPVAASVALTITIAAVAEAAP